MDGCLRLEYGNKLFKLFSALNYVHISLLFAGTPCREQSNRCFIGIYIVHSLILHVEIESINLFFW